jgi:hypothetical protein
MHLGLIEIGFNKCDDLYKASEAMASTGRNNFKVLTSFISIASGHNLVVLYSETPLDDNAKKIFKYVTELEKNRILCK